MLDPRFGFGFLRRPVAARAFTTCVHAVVRGDDPDEEFSIKKAKLKCHSSQLLLPVPSSTPKGV